MEQKKLVTTLVLGLTLVLTLTAVFTAFKIFKIGKKPAVGPTPPPLPAKPTASPAVPEIFQAGPGVCELSFDVQATPTPTPTPSPTPVPTCNSICSDSSLCPAEMICELPSGRCRNPSCSGESSCVCPTATPTPTPSPTPTPFFQCTDLGPHPGQPNPGDLLTFTCQASATNISIDHYNFQVLDSVSSVAESDRVNTGSVQADFTFAVPATGTPFTVQCQVCVSSNDSNCTGWGQSN